MGGLHKHTALPREDEVKRSVYDKSDSKVILVSFF